VVVPAPKKKKIDAGPIYFTSFTTTTLTAFISTHEQ
jgi:hypothetical protein